MTIPGHDRLVKLSQDRSPRRGRSAGAPGPSSFCVRLAGGYHPAFFPDQRRSHAGRLPVKAAQHPEGAWP